MAFDQGLGLSAHAVTAAPQDPRNNMPIEPNQQPFPGQRKYISVSRQESTIPKGGTESTWVYPSPQMFYNGVSPAPHCLQSMLWRSLVTVKLASAGIKVSHHAILCMQP